MHVLLGKHVNFNLYNMQDHYQNKLSGSMGNKDIGDAAQVEGYGFSKPVRMHMRRPIDGLTCIGWGTTLCQPLFGNQEVLFSPKSRLEWARKMDSNHLLATYRMIELIITESCLVMA